MASPILVSSTLPDRWYVWAAGVKDARDRVARELVKQGLAPSRSLLPKLDVHSTGLTRTSEYRMEWNAETQEYEAQASTGERRYAVDIAR